MTSPESIGDWAEGEVGYEDMNYVAFDAYEKKTGNEFPYDSNTGKCPEDPVGDEWDEDKLDALYPELCKKFG